MICRVLLLLKCDKVLKIKNLCVFFVELEGLYYTSLGGKKEVAFYKRALFSAKNRAPFIRWSD